MHLHDRIDTDCQVLVSTYLTLSKEFHFTINRTQLASLIVPPYHQLSYTSIISNFPFLIYILWL
nr:MAG TPA: hypothetical protein [Caudoviricetes sp.]